MKLFSGKHRRLAAQSASQKFRAMERLAQADRQYRVIVTESPDELAQLKAHLDVLNIAYENVFTSNAITGPGWAGQRRIPAVRVSQAAFVYLATSRLLKAN